LPCGQEYRINAALDGYDVSYENLSAIGSNCGAGGETETNLTVSKRKILKVETYVDNHVPVPQPAVPAAQYAHAGHSYTPCNPCVTCVPCGMPVSNCASCNATKAVAKTVKYEKVAAALEFNEDNLRKGSVIGLDDILYEYNDYKITEDAIPSLDKLLALMSDKSEMTIEMRSHTDSRGSAGYNQRLSLQRAKAARDYLISRGINCDRITYRGYGEKRLLNDCGDGIDCDESVHAKNRRTEFRITNFR